jgi:catechol 2,3-dioxygenase
LGPCCYRRTQGQPLGKEELMNTEIIIHPKLQHYGLMTANLEAMIDWYRKVLGMTINHRYVVPAEAQSRATFSAMAFVTNDEVNHRIVFFEIDRVAESDRGQGPLQHIAFEYETFDDLLGTYARLKGLSIPPLWAADHGVGTAFYYADPDRNIVELDVNNYGNEWAATEHLKNVPPMMAQVDPEQMLAARMAGASPWELHMRASAGEFAAVAPRHPRT